MTRVEIGGVSYRLFALPSEGRWVARAFKANSGERFGVDACGPTESAAVQGLREWLEWHHDHVAALEALRRAERAYHRAVTDAAFPGSGADALTTGKAPLEQLDSARAALDSVRARRPEHGNAET
jgi:hypothetical protein